MADTGTASSGGAGAGLALPTALAAAVLAVLLGLGTWQLQRKVWKDGLVSQIAARTTAPAVPLEEALRRARAGEDLEYTRVQVNGRWRTAPEAHLWTATSSGPGWQVFAALDVVPVNGTRRTVIVNRGFVPDARRDRAARPEPELAAPGSSVSLVGLLRKSEVKGAFTPDNEATRNIWYWRDLSGMARAMQLDEASLVPFFLEAEKGSPAGPLGPQGGATRLDIPNNHLQYAVTWYGLAATLVGVYTAFAWGRLRRHRT